MYVPLYGRATAEFGASALRMSRFTLGSLCRNCTSRL